MKKLYLFLIIPFLMGATIPEPPKDDKSSIETQQYLKTIYEELKRNVDLTSGVTGALPIANGGTNSTTAQTAIDALLPSQTGNSGKFLTTNATNSSWGTATDTNTSNVLYCWLGSDVGTTDIVGMVEGTSLTPAMSTYTVNYHFFGAYGATYRTILTGRFVKIAGISTVTIHGRLWSSSALVNEEAYLNVDIGGQSNVVSSSLSSTPTWVTTSTINVSSLTNGSTYDITIQLKNNSATKSAYCSGVILTGS